MRGSRIRIRIVGKLNLFFHVKIILGYLLDVFFKVNFTE